MQGKGDPHKDGMDFFNIRGEIQKGKLSFIYTSLSVCMYCVIDPLNYNIFVSGLCPSSGLTNPLTLTTVRIPI